MAVIPSQVNGRTAAMVWSIAGLGLVWVVVFINLPTMKDVRPVAVKSAVADGSDPKRESPRPNPAPTKRSAPVAKVAPAPVDLPPASPAVPKPAPANTIRWKEAPAYMTACAAEIKRLCAKVAGQDGPVLQCLQRQTRDLSNRCFVTLPTGGAGTTATRITRAAK